MISNCAPPRLWNILPALALTGTVLVVGCTGILDVQRPTLISAEQVASDTALLRATAQGAIEPFRNEYAWVAHAGAGQTDEALLTHGWSPWNEYDDRNVTPAGGAYDGISYPFLQQARENTGKTVERLQALLGDKATSNASYATANAYAGYSNLLIADHLCKIPINKTLKTPDEVRNIAIGFFAEAIKDGAAASAVDAVSLATVGTARAYLGMGNWSKAIEFANKVPADFRADVGYVSDPDFGHWTIYNLYNRVAGLRSPSEFTLGYAKEDYEHLNDLRVPMESDKVRKMFDSRPAERYAILPYLPSSFSGWTPGGKTMMTENASIRFSSGLEARYIVAEASLSGGAGGISNAQVRAFIDERRAVGGKPAFPGVDTGLLDELIEQRKMDFMLAGFRMPDLIRYKRFYSKDLWPKGKMEGWLNGDYAQQYGSTECWPIGASERL
ncbi:MAG: hypothetical protein ABJE10_09055 [bacterium]